MQFTRLVPEESEYLVPVYGCPVPHLLVPPPPPLEEDYLGELLLDQPEARDKLLEKICSKRTWAWSWRPSVGAGKKKISEIGGRRDNIFGGGAAVHKAFPQEEDV